MLAGKSYYAVILMTKFVIAMMPNPIHIGQSSIAPASNMSGQGDCSCAFTMDLSNRDFRAMILFDFFGGRSYWECFTSSAIFWGEKSPTKSTMIKWYRKFQLG